MNDPYYPNYHKVPRAQQDFTMPSREMRLYMEAHRRCPECSSLDICQTAKPSLMLPGRDCNVASCHQCGWQGVVHQLTPGET